MNYIYIYI